jgi:hypothetical protein
MEDMSSLKRKTASIIFVCKIILLAMQWKYWKERNMRKKKKRTLKHSVSQKVKAPTKSMTMEREERSMRGMKVELSTELGNWLDSDKMHGKVTQHFLFLNFSFVSFL